MLELQPSTLFKKMLWLSCFPVDFAKFSRKTSLLNTSRRAAYESLTIPSFEMFQEFCYIFIKRVSFVKFFCFGELFEECAYQGDQKS